MWHTMCLLHCVAIASCVTQEHHATYVSDILDGWLCSAILTNSIIYFSSLHFTVGTS